MKKILLVVLLVVGIIGGAQITQALPLEGVSVSPSRVAVSFDATTGMVRGSFLISMTNKSNEFGCISLPGTTIRLGGSSDVRLSELASYCNWGSFSINVSFSTPYTNTQKGEYTFQIGGSRGSQTGSQPVTIAVPGFELRDVGSVTAINPHNEKITGDYEQSGYVYYFDQTRKALGEEVLFRSTGVYRQPPETSAGNGKLWVVGQNTDLKVGNYIEGRRITSVDWGQGQTCYVNNWNSEKSCTNPMIWVGEITTDTTTGGSLSFQFGLPYRLQELKISTPPVTKDFSITVGNAEVPLESKQLLLGSSRYSVGATFPVSIDPVSGVSCSDISLSAVGNSQFMQGVQSSVTKTGSCTGTVSGTVSNVWFDYIKYPPYQIENKMTNEDLNLIESQAITVTGIVGATQKKDSGGVSFKKSQGEITITPSKTSYEFSGSVATGNTVRIPVTITTKNISGTVTVNRPDVPSSIIDYIDASYNPSITTMDGNSSKTVDLVLTKTNENKTQSIASGPITLSASGGGISDSDLVSVSINPNEVPTCTLNMAYSGELTAPKSIFFSANINSKLGIASYSFDPNIQGLNPTTGANGFFYSTNTYNLPGAYTPTLTITDYNGKSGQCSTEIVLKKPEAQKLSCAMTVPANGKVGELIPISIALSNGTKPFSGKLNAGDNSGVQYKSSTSGSFSYNHTYINAGKFNLSFEVEDDFGQVASCAGAITIVKEQTKPQCSLVASKSTVQKNEAVTITAQSSGGKTPYIIKLFSKDGLSFVSGDASFTKELSYGAVGTYKPKLIIYDSNLDKAECSTSITVTEGPQALSCSVSASPTSGTGMLNTSFTITPSGGKAPYGESSFTAGDGSFTESKFGADIALSYNHTYSKVGIFTPSFTLKDSSGATATCSTNVEVKPAEEFSCSLSASPTSGTGTLNTSFTITPSGGKAPYGESSFTAGDGSFTESKFGANIALSYSHTYSKVGIFTPSFTLKDSSGATATCSTNVEVKPAEEFSCSLSASPSSGTAVPLGVSFAVNPIGGTTPYLSSSFYAGYTGAKSETRSRFLNQDLLSFSHTYTALGTYYPTATLVDNKGVIKVCSLSGGLKIAPVDNPSELSASLEVNPLSGEGPLTVSVSLSASGGNGSIVKNTDKTYSYYVNSGSGVTVSTAKKTDTSYSTTFSYPKVSKITTYTISGSVTDALNAKKDSSVTVTVYPPSGTGDTSDEPKNLCASVVCDNKCEGYTELTGGTCNPSTGKCSYSGSEQFSTSCGYVPVSCTITSSKLIGLPPFKPTLTVNTSGGTGSYAVTIYPTGESTPSFSGKSYAYIFTTAGKYNSYARVSDSANPSSSKTCTLPVPITVYGSTGGETNP